MKKLPAVVLFVAIGFAGVAAGAPDQRASGPPEQKQDAAAALEEVRQAVEARLIQRGLKGTTVTATRDKRARRLEIALRPLNKNPRDDASSALNTAWQAAVRQASAFDEITVRVGANYSVTCPRRAFADPSISLWGEGLTRTCREQRGK